jgi:hypothetical protein
MDAPACGARVRLNDREGFVSDQGIGDLTRAGEKFVTAGVWIEVTLNDGKGPASAIRLYEDQWDTLEILST